MYQTGVEKAVANVDKLGDMLIKVRFMYFLFFSKFKYVIYFRMVSQWYNKKKSMNS
jgi:hypothetical protein